LVWKIKLTTRTFIKELKKNNPKNNDQIKKIEIEVLNQKEIIPTKKKKMMVNLKTITQNRLGLKCEIEKKNYIKG